MCTLSLTVAMTLMTPGFRPRTGNYVRKYIVYNNIKSQERSLWSDDKQLYLYISIDKVKNFKEVNFRYDIEPLMESYTSPE